MQAKAVSPDQSIPESGPRDGSGYGGSVRRKGMMNSIRIDYDSDYGIDKRSGWSISFGGIVYVELERFLAGAIIKAVGRFIRLRENGK